MSPQHCLASRPPPNGAPDFVPQCPAVSPFSQRSLTWDPILSVDNLLFCLSEEREAACERPPLQVAHLRVLFQQPFSWDAALRLPLRFPSTLHFVPSHFIPACGALVLSSPLSFPLCLRGCGHFLQPVKISRACFSFKLLPSLSLPFTYKPFAEQAVHSSCHPLFSPLHPDLHHPHVSPPPLAALNSAAEDLLVSHST